MSKPILEEKDILNPNEAIELFVLSRRKFYKLLKENRQLNFLAMYAYNGAKMLLYQGIIAFELWTGCKVESWLA